MVSIVENVHQVSIEGVDVVQLGEAVDDATEFLIHRFLHEFDLSHVELADSLDFETLTDLSRRLALGLRQHNVDQIVSIWDLDDRLEVVSTRCHLKKLR